MPGYGYALSCSVKLKFKTRADPGFGYHKCSSGSRFSPVIALASAAREGHTITSDYSMIDGASRISVVVPVYNAEMYVRDAIESVLCQTYSDLELVAVDDGSTDGSLRILRSISDTRLRVITQCNRGQSATINTGVGASQGAFIKIMDADDWINPRHLESQLNSLRWSADCVSLCRWGYFHTDFKRPQMRCEYADRDYDDALEWIVDSLTRDEGMMGGWRWLIPRRVWERSGGYDERLSLNNDFHASIAVLMASKGVRFAPDAVYSYRKGLSGALSGCRSRRAMQSAFLTTELGCQLLLDRENSDRIRRICANRYQRWAFDFFPEHADLSEVAERAASELGGAAIDFPGGQAARLLNRVIGWRNVRRCQTYAVRCGWGQVQRLKRWWRMRRMA